MKDLILDNPIRHSFPDFLGKGETIVWEGKPCFDTLLFGDSNRSSDDFGKHRTIAIYLFFTMLMFIAIYNEEFLMGSFYFFANLFLFLFLGRWKKKKNKHYKYAITQKQILFQFKEKWWHKNPIFHSIPFSEIKDIIIIMRYDLDRLQKQMETGRAEFNEQDYIDKGLDKIGSIIIVPHHPELIPFETKDLANNGKRHQPSIELLEDVEKVAKMIREGTRTNVK